MNDTEPHILFCETCGKPLTGRQTKFCGRNCKNRSTNARNQIYKNQQARGLVRKQELVRLFGGKCQICGYSKNIHALSFHHLNPADKTIALSLRSLSNNSWDTITAEASKCKLLCLNCHSEVHNCH